MNSSSTTKVKFDATFAGGQTDAILKVLLFAFASFLALVDSAAADSDLPPPDVLACLKAVEHLDLRYRGVMQQNCFGAAGDICLGSNQGAGACLSALTRELRAFNADLLGRLPDRIEEGGFRARGYERALKRAAESQEGHPDCADLTGDELATCDYIQLAAIAADLIYRARLANVPLP